MRTLLPSLSLISPTNPSTATGMKRHAYEDKDGEKDDESGDDSYNIGLKSKVSGTGDVDIPFKVDGESPAVRCLDSRASRAHSPVDLID